jgi:hypothetical protein
MCESTAGATHVTNATRALAGVLLFGCGCGGKPEPVAVREQHDQFVSPPPSSSGVTKVEMVNVRVRLDPELIVHILRLSGTLIPTKNGQAPTFDDKLSYVIAVDSAEVSVSSASMSRLMNTYVFGDSDAPLKNVKVTTEGSEIKQEGTIRKGIGIPFEMVGEVSPTPDGRMNIHPKKIKAAHLPVKGLFKMFGVDMAKLINTKHARGIQVNDNDVILDALQALPPPKMRGKMTAVWVQGDDIILLFGAAKKGLAGSKPGSNYMAYRGGVLRFGKLTMHDTDLRLTDANPADPFDFFPDHYNDHLVAGYSKTTPSGGLIVYMPDYSKIPQGSR